MSDNKVMRILREVNKYGQAYVVSVLDIDKIIKSKLDDELSIKQ